MAADKMAVATVLLLSYVAVSMVSACVPPTCVFVTHRPDARWDLNNPWLIALIALSCAFFLAILSILLWLCCYCFYRDNASAAPRILRRIIRVRHPVKREEYVEKPPRRILHVIAPPPPPPPPPPPSDKIIVVPAACPEPPSTLLLTVSEGLHAGNIGPDMTTMVDRPLTFMLTPQADGIRQSGLRVGDCGCCDY